MKPVITNIKTTLFGKIAAVLLGLFVVTIPFAIGQTTETPAGTQATNPSMSDPAADLNAQITEKRKQLEELRQQAGAYQDAVDSSSKQVRDIQSQIGTIDSQIAQTKFQIQLKQAEIDTLELEMKALQGQIDEKNAAIGTQKDRLSEAVRQLDQNSRTSTLAVLVRNKSLSDFYGQAQAVASISQSLQDAIGNLSRLKDDLEATQNQPNTKRDDVQQAKLQLEVQKGSTVEQRSLKETLLTHAEDSRDQYESLLIKSAQEEQAANATISALEKELQQRLSGEDPSTYQFNSDGYIWPVTGTITAYFRDPSYPFRKTIGEHFGLDIAVPQGTPVRAAADGIVSVVVNPGFSTTETGRKLSALNYIGICHDEKCNVVSRYLHMYSIDVAPFDYVRQGQVIGLSGGLPGTQGAGAGLSTGAHLHFEVREEGFPVDPLKYLP